MRPLDVVAPFLLVPIAAYLVVRDGWERAYFLTIALAVVLGAATLGLIALVV